MDLAHIKKLTDRIRKQNGGRRPVPQEMHMALKREARLFKYYGPEKMREFISKISKPGYEPSVFELYILKEIIDDEQ